LVEEGARDIERGDYVAVKTPEELREIVRDAWAGYDLEALRELIDRRRAGTFASLDELEATWAARARGARKS
jgi:hypothetical protein